MSDDAPYEVLGSDVAHASSFNTIRVHHVRMADGRETIREIVEHRSAVAAVAVDEGDRLVMVRQYRHAFGQRLLEIPAGVLDVDGEAVADAMQRELAEEVQLGAGSLEPLVSYRNSAGWTTETTTVLLATDLHPAEVPDGFEPSGEEADMDVLRVPFADALAMVRDGRITDGKTIVGILALADRRRPTG